MKQSPKCAFVLIALMATAITACEEKNPNDDDSDINYKEKSTIVVNTENLYEELGILPDMKDLLASNESYSVIDSVLIYNEEGLLVAKKGLQSRTLGREVLYIDDLGFGDYTMIMWQTVYSRSVRPWSVTDEESLSTVSIKGVGTAMGFRWAIGCDVCRIGYYDVPTEIEFTPKSMGCLLDVTLDNYTEELGYANVAMYGWNAEDWNTGFYLDPSLGEDARWIVSESSLEMPFKIKYGSETSRKFFSLVHGDDLSFFITGNRGDDSYDDLGTCYHKSVKAGQTYKVYLDIARYKWQPVFFGSEEDFVSWKADRDAGLLVFDPCVNWGCGLAEVEESVHNKQWWRTPMEELKPSYDNWYISYWVSNSMYESYLFKTQDGQNLISAFCICIDSAVPMEMARHLVLSQGYEYAGKIQYPGQSESYDVFFSPDKKTEVMIYPIEGDGWTIRYEPTNPADLPYIKAV